MKSIRLLKPGYKKVGWLFFILGAGLWILNSIFKQEIDFLYMDVFAVITDESILSLKRKYFSFTTVNIGNTLAGIFAVVGGLLITFSREKKEDEFIQSLRLRSFQWAFLLNYLILLILFIFVYGMSFLTIMVYQMFLILILYILRFHYLLYLNRAEA